MPKRHVGGGVHLADGGVEHVGHALAAVGGVAGEAGPAAVAQEVEGGLEAVRRAHDAVLEQAALAVADGVQRREDVAGELAGLLEDRGGEVAVEVGVAGDGGVLDGEHVVQHEGHVAERRGVGGHAVWSSCGYSAALRHAALGEQLLGPCHLLAEVGDRQVELGALRLHRPQAGEAEVVGAGDLRRLLVADVVEVEELADVLEREAEALALQDQLEPRPAAAGEEALLALADRGDELLAPRRSAACAGSRRTRRTSRQSSGDRRTRRFHPRSHRSAGPCPRAASWCKAKSLRSRQVDATSGRAGSGRRGPVEWARGSKVYGDLFDAHFMHNACTARMPGNESGLNR